MKSENLEGRKKSRPTKKETVDNNEKVKMVKDDVSEVVKEKPNIKKHSNVAIFVVILIILILIILGVVIWFLRPDDNSNNSIGSLTNEDNNKIVLKQTESSTVKSEGVYITDVSDVVDEVMPSIVAITSKTIINSGRFGPSYYGNSSSNRYVAEGAGSGVIVATSDDEIFILTNYHVVEDTTELSVKFIDDESYDAKIKGTSEKKDIAVVSVSKKDMKSSTLEKIKVATLGDSDILKVGNGIIAIGNALGYGQSVTTGVVSALNREVKTDNYSQDMIQIDAAINGGNSGGALLNSKGEVVGINTAKYSSSGYSSSASIEGMGFAIPISKVKSVIEDLINGKSEQNDNLLLGIEGYMTNSNGLSGYGMPVGFYVSVISKDGNASNSDLEIGNIITEIDNNKVTSLDVIKNVLSKKEKGDKVTLKVKYPSRNEYKEREIIITLSK